MSKRASTSERGLCGSLQAPSRGEASSAHHGGERRLVDSNIGRQGAGADERGSRWLDARSTSGEGARPGEGGSRRLDSPGTRHEAASARQRGRNLPIDHPGRDGREVTRPGEGGGRDSPDRSPREEATRPGEGRTGRAVGRGRERAYTSEERSPCCPERSVRSKRPVSVKGSSGKPDRGGIRREIACTCEGRRTGPLGSPGS